MDTPQYLVIWPLLNGASHIQRVYAKDIPTAKARVYKRMFYLGLKANPHRSPEVRLA